MLLVTYQHKDRQCWGVFDRDRQATGTPAGVGMGFKPARFLRGGDAVSVTIEPIGCLQNPVH